MELSHIFLDAVIYFSIGSNIGPNYYDNKPLVLITALASTRT
jgi:hypothetical protein